VFAGMLDPYTEAYPDKLMTKVEITMNDGTKLSCEKEDYPGFFTRPFSWEQVIEKFDRLTAGNIDATRQQQIINVVQHLEEHDTTELLQLLNIRGGL
jgi:2-methylcitrate dehydratase